MFLRFQAVLAAIIIAVTGLMDLGTPRRLWCYNKADAATLILAFVEGFAVGVRKGIHVLERLKSERGRERARDCDRMNERNRTQP